MSISRLLVCHPAFCSAVLMTVLSVSTIAVAAEADDNLLARGEYLSRVAGCNDCHTAGYPEAAGNIPKSQWLLGANVGFQGPWGTSYPANLRLYFASLTEQEWLARARQPMLPPMPWFGLRDMSDDDLLAIYRFTRSLGAAGEKVPMASGPGQQVNTPYIEFFPKNLPMQATAH